MWRWGWKERDAILGIEDKIVKRNIVEIGEKGLYLPSIMPRSIDKR